MRPPHRARDSNSKSKFDPAPPQLHPMLLSGSDSHSHAPSFSVSSHSRNISPLPACFLALPPSLTPSLSGLIHPIWHVGGESDVASVFLLTNTHTYTHSHIHTLFHAYNRCARVRTRAPASAHHPDNPRDTQWVATRESTRAGGCPGKCGPTRQKSPGSRTLMPAARGQEARPN